jgi:hypothetical protein
MNRSYLIAAIAIIAMPSAQATLAYPSLKCEAIACLGDKGSTCRLESWKPFQLEVQANGREVLWKESTTSEPARGVILESTDSLIIYDFGVGAHGGDQYSEFSFATDHVHALSAGKIASITGEYEDGYDWADGYHTRAQIQVRCTK